MDYKDNSGKSMESDFEEIINEDRSVCKEFEEMMNEISGGEARIKAREISERLGNLQQGWRSLVRDLQLNIINNKTQAEEYVHSIKSSSHVLRRVQSDKKRIKSQEIILTQCEERLGRTLGKFKGLWQENLSDMECSLASQRKALKRIRQQYFDSMAKIELEINEVLCLDKQSEKSSKRPENRSRRSSNRSSVASMPPDEDIISNRSAFSFATEDIASIQNHSSRKPSREKVVIPKNPEIQEKPQLKKKKSPRVSCNSKSYNDSPKYQTTSPKVAIEGSSISFKEIKEALIILKQANLINNNGNRDLLHIAEMIKDPESSSNVELLLQILNLENKKTRVPSMHRQTKPLTPLSRSKIRNFQADLDDTSREKFRLSEEKSFDRTILSNECIFSPKVEDYSERFDRSKREDLKDVMLEDLLNVTSIIEDLGLLSADNSMLNEINGTSEALGEVKELKEDRFLKGNRISKRKH